MQNNPSAIPTQYGFTTYRSRLEARWALFLDLMGIHYIYEPRGYDIGQSYSYVPDFYLPRVCQYAEVKPRRLSDQEIGKCRDLFSATNKEIILLIGPPDFVAYEAVTELPPEPNENFPGFFSYSLDRHHGEDYYETEKRFYSDPDYPVPFDELNPDHLSYFSNQYREAVRRARFHRFTEGS